MCGICGWVGPGENAAERLDSMMAVLAHRGPEGAGRYLGPGVALGFRRLRIVDVTGGDQPLANEDGTLRMVLNGEIYNAPELRRELESRGHRFATRSDAEPVLHLYEEEGEACLHRLRGMFGLALWDARGRRLLLARDRLGIKPLHYTRVGSAVAFASEAKALLAGGWAEPRLDLEALRQLFAFGFVLTPRTLLAGCRRLPPGHLLAVSEDGHVELRRWWSPSFPARGEYERRRPESWAEELLALLRESVRLHLRSDVPVGAWLSSGLDSSTVVALMSAVGTPPADIVSLAFEAPECNEVGGTPTLSALGGAPPSRTAWCTRDHLALLPRAAWHSEAPTLSGLEVPRLLLARASAERVKVVLTGEGADEILGGYRWYHGQRVLGPLAGWPLPLRRLLSGGPVGARLRPRAAALLLAPPGMDLPRFRAMVAPDHWRWAARVAPVLGEHPPEWHLDPPPPPEFAAWHPFCRLQYLDMRVRLPDFVIHTLDRSSMAAAVEARVPFLDHRVVEFAARIPPHVKMRGLVEKHVLRAAVRGLLPEGVRRRSKRGMDTPVDWWFRGPLPRAVEELMDPRALAASGIFHPPAVRELLDLHRRGRVAAGRVLCGVAGVQAVLRGWAGRLP